MRTRNIQGAGRRGTLLRGIWAGVLLISSLAAQAQNTAATRRLINDAASIAALALTDAGTQPNAIARTAAWSEHALKKLSDSLRPPQRVPAGEPLELVFGAPGAFYHLTAQTALLTIAELRRQQSLLPTQTKPGVPLPQDVLNALGRMWMKPDVQQKIRQQTLVSRSAMNDFLSRPHPVPPPFDPNGLLGPLPKAEVAETFGTLGVVSPEYAPFDPNGKTSRCRIAAFQQPAVSEYDAPFVYTVCFENLDAATARILGRRAGGPTQQVNLADTPSSLQNSTGAQTVNVSLHHPSPTDTLSLTPNGLQLGVPYPIGATPVHLVFQNSGGRLTWVFGGSAATLPAGGKGSVSFQIQPAVPRRDVGVVANPGADIQFFGQPSFRTNGWIP